MSAFPDDAYAQDPIVPFRVEHRHEFGDPQPEKGGGFGYEYDYIAYEFRDGPRGAQAVHYMDEPGTVTVRWIDPPELRSDFAMRILVFLSMRFDTVRVPSASGGYAPLAGHHLEDVRRRLEDHREGFRSAS